MSKSFKISKIIEGKEVFTSNYKLMLLMIRENNSIKSDLEYSNTQIWKSLYIISTFRTIECMINYLKKDVISEQKYQDLGLSNNQRKKLNEYYTVSRDGKKQRKTKKIPFADNVTFAFDMFNNANFVFESIDKSTKDWENFKKAIMIRNRIVHPRFLKDIHICKNDLEIVNKAYNWFFDTFDDFHRKGAKSLMEQAEALKNAFKDAKN